MTDEEKRILKNFDAHVRQLLRQYSVLQQENKELYAELEGKDIEIEKLHAEIGQHKKDYATLKLAKMIEVSDSEMKDAKQRLTKLVRDVNKCIGLLSTEQE